ncbi:hypothetical protein DLAC_05417 [Tieghemostelium lacteum]|uniref:tRNA-dihydrouridine synthase n=1 Tax=Tieghemostelium lacteum TaxID=361077 RepID=A0A151ZFS7_TIELA|nr:hypothetical protein DLAC_05417 [Tieghemostelium lacteum]|eukprot:KYQ92831.1 hypothetical protein DLAC_05417 [Tieghemostelium lacteum]
MNGNFWNRLKKPILVSAPMVDVTDCVFRYLLTRYSKPNVIFNEFISADGLTLGNRDRFMKDLRFHYSEDQHHVAQFFGSKPQNFKVSAQLAKQLQWDGIDINMGCPSRKVISPKQASGIALILNPSLAQDIISATMEGAPDLPVSVKTRIGWDEIEIDHWIPSLLKMKPSALTVHLRTKKELSLVPAHWEHSLISKILEMRDSISPTTKIIGNGDIESLQDAHIKIQHFQIDGAMIGRALYGNPWFFSTRTFQIDNNNDSLSDYITIGERFRVILEHAILLEHLIPYKPIVTMSRHYTNYLSGLSDLGDNAILKKNLIAAENSIQIHSLLNQYLEQKGKSIYTLDYQLIKANIINSLTSNELSIQQNLLPTS